MGHTGPRTNSNVLNYNIGVMDSLWSLEGDVWVFHPELVTPAKAQSLGEMLGGLKSDYAKQYGNAPFPTDPDSGGGTQPVPPSGDPLARVFAAPSQWAKWLDLSDAEAQALIDGGYITREEKNQNNNWWFQNGVKGGYDAATGKYVYSTFHGGVEKHNVDATVSTNPVRGMADGATEAACGQTIPGPDLP